MKRLTEELDDSEMSKLDKWEDIRLHINVKVFLSLTFYFKNLERYLSNNISLQLIDNLPQKGFPEPKTTRG